MRILETFADIFGIIISLLIWLSAFYGSKFEIGDFLMIKINPLLKNSKHRYEED